MTDCSWLAVNDVVDEGHPWLRLWENAVPISEHILWPLRRVPLAHGATGCRRSRGEANGINPAFATAAQATSLGTTP
ncbi:MAG TPA: hypothetical protein VJR93_04030 [Chthoniobacterales bacterium]|nr:hypothetical protein [Chthoniobacterales bacterium]